jgi:hypothetical protein
MRRDFEFGFEDFDFDNECTPWYIQRMLDEDVIHVSIDDIQPDFFEALDWIEKVSGDDSEFKRVDSDVIMGFFVPVFLRERGYSPDVSIKDYKLKMMSKIKSLAPNDLLSAEGVFRDRIQRFLNEQLSSLYLSDDFDTAKSIVRSILDLLGLDFPLEAVSLEDVSLYLTSYIPYVRVFNVLGLFDLEMFRHENKVSYYVKKVPEASLWDYRDFLERAGAEFIASTLFRSFRLLKESGPSSEWSRLYDEALVRFDLIENLLVKVPSSYTRNLKGEVWKLVHPDFFYSVLRKKVLSLVEEIPLGYREEFSTFFLPEELQKIILNPRVVFRPWVKIK